MNVMLGSGDCLIFTDIAAVYIVLESLMNVRCVVNLLHALMLFADICLAKISLVVVLE